MSWKTRLPESMTKQLPDFSRLPDDDAEKLHRVGFGALVLLFILLFLVILYAMGEKANHFNWGNLRRGLLTFGIIILSTATVIVSLVGLVRTGQYIVPQTMQHLAEKRRLKNETDRVHNAIDKKRELNEERARLTARLQATYLFEKESTRTANAQASREFREALQSSVMRSCEIAFDHISKVVEQYEAVVAEIQASSLSAEEKSELLSSLTEQLDVAATEQRNQDSRRMMESEIWKIRFRKARIMAKEKPSAAVRYLKEVRPEARGNRLKAKIDELISTLGNPEAGQ